ncbi:MAG: ribosome biogenesis GTP-binding protein YihA/YsxC [Clostridiales bacterium]|nr:ribosome biogenesis GTP-binding protein YihA/YsxC [Clostridiales bacterium]
MFVDFSSLRLEITAGRPDQFPKEGSPAGRRPQIAFSGRSNVGKSSLINAITGTKGPARVSSSPGKTVTINFYSASDKAYLVDLPGYGFARRSGAEKKRFSELTDAYLSGAAGRRLKLIVQLIDMTAGPTEDDLLMIDWMTRIGVPYLIVISKADKPNAAERAAMTERISELGGIRPPIPVSAKNGEGLKQLISEIIKVI